MEESIFKQQSMKTSQLSVVAVNMNIAEVFYSVTYFIFVLLNSTLDMVFYFHTRSFKKNRFQATIL